MSGNPPEKVFNLEGLRSLPLNRGMRLGVVGLPVRHSLSPAMHTAALKALAATEARFSDWSYDAFELRPEDLPEAVSLFRERGFRGVNLTVPHKVEALSLVDRIDPTAAKMGAVNTLVFEEEGVHGYNTDGYGLEHAIREAFGQGLVSQSVLIVGAGGAARAAAVQCLESGVEELWIANRTVEKAEGIVRRLSGKPAQAVTVAEAPSCVPTGTLVINATSLGLNEEDPVPVAVEELPEHCRLFDMIYNPAQTAFLTAGLLRGYPVSNGLGMLVHQGVRSLEIWTGKPVDATVMRSACTAV